MRVFIVLVLMLCVGCASKSKVLEDARIQRLAKEIQEKIDKKEFAVFVTAASPLANQDIARIGLLPPGSSANRIMLNGNEYIKLLGDKVDVALPFYGTQQLPSGYLRGMSGFNFTEPYENYKYSYNEKKKMHTIKFKVKNHKELISVFIKIYKNGLTDVYLNSSHRTAINYDGKLKTEW